MAKRKYDAFLSHNSADKPAVEELGRWLEDEAGFKVWLDRWHLVPGDPWQEELERGLDDSACCVVFVGPAGIAGWHHEEMRAALEDRVRGELRVLPVLLPGASKPDGIPKFLRRLDWVEFRESLSERESRRLLVSGVRGEAPGRPEHEGLGSELDTALERLEELTALGEETAEATDEVLRLKRSIRHGAQPQPRDFLGRHHKLIEPIGQGGFATVWRALDRRTRTVVAAKVLHGQWSESAERRERFFRGARQMAKLDHSSIVRVLSSQEYDYPFHYFVMEYLDGGDFQEAVLGGMSMETAIDVVLKVGEALQYAHDRGVIHRDVKPANILLSKAGAVKLTDFDLVQAGDTTGGTRTGALGTVVYAAPESMDDAKNATAAADVYSLGMVLLFGLVGRKLTTRDMFEPEGTLLGITCLESIKDVVRRSISHAAKDRWASVKSLCDSLRASLSGGAVVTPESPLAALSLSSGETVVPYLDSAVVVPPERTTSGPTVEWRELESGLGAIALLTVSGVRYRLRWVRAGCFLMGSPKAERELYGREGPRHDVTLTRGFWLGETPCTQELWEAVMDTNPSHFRGPRCPVEQVSWGDSQEFLSQLNGLGVGRGFRLPTEAEWEYACRAESEGPTYDDNQDLKDLAWFGGNSGGWTHPVGQKLPNEWGFRDMLGNVWEWCLDCYGDYAQNRQVDPTGPTDGRLRVVRGASWHNVAKSTRSAYRYAYPPSFRDDRVGFRIAREGTKLGVGGRAKGCQRIAGPSRPYPSVVTDGRTGQGTGKGLD